MKDPRKVIETTLGKTHAEIAAALKARGVTGKREDTELCPLAQYLSKTMETPVEVEDHIKWSDGEIICMVRSPQAVSDFTTAFDAGDYPELIEDMKDAEAQS